MRLAIFGATGGSVLSCLTQAIKAPDVTTITVLARTPTKLTDLLEKRNLSIPAKLKIVQGDAKSLEAVKECIQSTDVVITGIGQVLIPGSWSTWLKPSWTDPTLCADAMRTLLEATSQLPSPDRPKRLIVLSTTGADEHKRDVPLVFLPFYHYFLDVPHADKRVMEGLVRERAGDVFPESIILRPSLLTDGARTEGQVRLGEDVVGYTISREDVGVITFKLCGREGDQYVGKAICCSY